MPGGYPQRLDLVLPAGWRQINLAALMARASAEISSGQDGYDDPKEPELRDVFKRIVMSTAGSELLLAAVRFMSGGACDGLTLALPGSTVTGAGKTSSAASSEEVTESEVWLNSAHGPMRRHIHVVSHKVRGTATLDTGCVQYLLLLPNQRVAVLTVLTTDVARVELLTQEAESVIESFVSNSDDN